MRRSDPGFSLSQSMAQHRPAGNALACLPIANGEGMPMLTLRAGVERSKKAPAALLFYVPVQRQRAADEVERVRR
jgi:hypothetical protein